MTKPSWRAWYDKLKKPEFTPKPQTIGLIWTILYPIIALSFGYTFFEVYSGNWPQYVALPFIVNLVANLLFSPILFRLRNLMLATIDIIIVWVTIHWMIAVVGKYSILVALAQFPYLVWVSIAMGLQIMILLANRKP